MSSRTLAVVVPVHGNEATLEELHSRLRAALPAARIVFVDDASPDGSAGVIEGLASIDEHVEHVALAANRGQHAAVLEGFRHVGDADRVVVCDADLQDPPEAIPALTAALDGRTQVVFAGRRGRYQSAGRRLTSAAFKRTLAIACGVPRDAGMFMALEREAVDRLLELDGPAPFVVAMVGRAGLRSISVPVQRARREQGRSAYRGAARLRSAARGLRWGLWGRARSRAQTHAARSAHNLGQRSYYSDPEAKPGMAPRRSRYLERHLDVLCAELGLQEGARVLELGCGLGRYTLLLAERGFEVEAIDLSADLLGRLRPQAEARGVVLHHGDILDPPEDLHGGFDAVVGLFVLHHLHDLDASMQAVAAQVRPGGRVGFVEPNPFNPLYYAQMAIVKEMTWEGDRGIVEMRRRRLLGALDAAGIEEGRLGRFGFLPPMLMDRPRGPAIESRIERLPGLGPVLPFQLLCGRLPGP